MVKDLRLSPWEKKPFIQRQKYLWRHYFGMMSFFPVFFVISPIVLYLQYLREVDPKSKMYNYQRYKTSYTVLRHDDPEVKNLVDYGPADPMYTIRFY